MKDRLPSVSLPTIEPYILGLPIGEVRRNGDGQAQVYFGGRAVETLTPYDSVEMRNGAIHVDMFTIDGRTDADYAEITITPKAAHRTPEEVAKNYRGLATTPRGDFIEQTPVQYFFSRRGFADIPISGRARWLAQDPEGNFSEGLFNSHDTPGDNQFVMFGEGWTFVWIVQSSAPFKFGELCAPRFIDQTENYPLGEDGIDELDPSTLTGEFAEKFVLYTTGKPLHQVA